MKRIALYFVLIPAMMFFSGGVSRAAKQQGSVGAYRQQCPQELGGTQSQAGLQTNNLSSPSGAMDITQKFNFTPCSASAGLASCYDGLFSDLGGTSYYNTKIFDQPLNYLQIKCASTHDKPCDEIPLSYVGNPATSYVRKAFSTPKYVRLGLWGPGMSRFNFNAVASGPKLNFKFYESFTMLNTPDVSDAVTAKVEVYGANGATLISQSVITPVCADVGIYDPDKQSRSLFYPAGVYPILRTCEYRDGSISIPPQALGQEISVRWRLTAHEGFNNPAGSGCKTPDNRPATCSLFTPYAFLSLDDIRFEAPSTLPTLACDSYEVGIGENPKCKLTENGRPVPSNSPWLFRVWKECETQRPPAQSISSAFTAAGMYSVDGVCQKTLSNGKKVFCGKTAKMANILVGSKPVVVRPHAGMAVIFPPISPLNDPSAQGTIAGYQISRKDTVGGSYRPVGQARLADMQASGYVDINLQRIAEPFYKLEPIYAGGRGIGPSTIGAKAPFESGNVSVTLKGYPKDSPTSRSYVLVNALSAVQAQAGGGSVSAGQSAGTPVRILANQSSILGFGDAGTSRGEWTPDWRGVITQTGYVPANMGFRAVFDTLHPDDARQTFWVLAGELANAPLSQGQWSKIFDQLVRIIKPLSLDRCTFKGDQYICSYGNNLMLAGIEFPIFSPRVAGNFKEFFYEMMSCTACKANLERNQRIFFPNLTQTIQLPQCTLTQTREGAYTPQCNMDPQQAEYLAEGMALYEMAKLSKWRPSANACLAGQGCGSFSRAEAFNYLEDRYLAGGAVMQAPAGDIQIVARSYATLLDNFTQPEQARLAKLEQQGSPWAQIINDARLEISRQLEFERQDMLASWNGFKDALYTLTGTKGAAVKGLAMWAVEGASLAESLLNLMADAASVSACGTADPGLMLAASMINENCRRAVLDYTTNLQNRDPFIDTGKIESLMTNNMMDTADVALFYTAKAAPDVAMLPWKAGVRAGLKLLNRVKAAMVFRQGARQVTVGAVELTEATGKTLAVAQASADNAGNVVLKTAEAVPAHKIPPAAEVDTIKGAIESATPNPNEVKVMVGPDSTSSLARDLQAAQRRGPQAMQEAAQCSNESYAATDKELPRAQITRISSNEYEVRFQRVQQGTGRPLILHPQGAELADYSQTFSDDLSEIAKQRFGPNGTYTRVPLGTQFARLDKSFNDLKEAIQHGQDLRMVGGPGGSNSYQRTLRNHVDNTPECIGNTGGGPRPLGGWVSTTLKENFDRLFSRFILGASPGRNRYIVIYEGQTGRNTVGYVNDLVDMADEAELSIPNMVPAQDIQRVRVYDTQTGIFTEVH